MKERCQSYIREIKVQQSFSSNDEVVEYLVTHHKYLCTIERMASPASEPQTAEYTNRLPPVNAICPHWSNLAWSNFSTFSNSSSERTSHLMEAPPTASTFYFVTICTK